MEKGRLVTQQSSSTLAASLRGGRRASWPAWAAILGGWILLSLFFAPEVYLHSLYKRQPIPLGEAFLLTAANTAIAAAFVPAIVWLTRRFPLGRGSWIRGLRAHVPACLAFSLAHSCLYAVLCYASPEHFRILFVRFHPNFVTYWAIVGFTEALDYFRKYRERERQLTQAQLELLKSQLQPHFLFNTLHTVSAMMHVDMKIADRMISKLSDLLRLALDGIGKHEATLRQEVEFVQRYLEIERIRFAEDLVLKLELDPEGLDCLVPSMLLQPIVENSVRHGFRRRKRSGVIVIQAYRRGGTLVLRVQDNGAGLSREPAAPQRAGLGLVNIRRRLEQLYPGRHRFDLQNRAAGGAVAVIEIPFRRAGVKEPPAALDTPNEYASIDRGRRAVGAEAHCDDARRRG